jgi:hypothetical protein
MRAILSVVVVVMLSACGSSGPSAQTACALRATDQCTELMMCSAAALNIVWGDLQTCETRETLACVNSLAAPKTAQTPDNQENCGKELATQACPAFLGGVTDPQDCLPPDGPGSNGTACSFAAECSSGFCAIPPYGLCGLCADQPAAGASCVDAGCADTMKCVAATSECQVPVGSGGQCSTALPCGAGYACVPDAGGTCMARGTTTGAACDLDNKTAPNCDPDSGLTCDGTTKMCVAQPLVGGGEPCGLIDEVDTECSGGGICIRASGSATGTCSAPASDGSACDTVNGPPCLLPAKCVTGGSAVTAGTCGQPGSMTCS